MFNNQKVVVTMTSWSKRIGNCVKVIQSVLDNTVKPDIVFLNLSLEEFPNRLKDLPRDLVELSLKNPKVKIGFDVDVQTIFTDVTVIDIGAEEEIDSRFIFNYIQSNVNNNQYDVIVSLTSFPNRFKNAHLIIKCLNSLVSQKTQYRYHIVMTLFKDDIPQLPSSIIDYCIIHDIEILPCSEDLKGHKKYFYVMQKYKYSPIITVDDDMIYSLHMVQMLCDKYFDNCSFAYCGWVRRITYDNNGNLKPDIYWESPNDEYPSIKNVGFSGSGLLIPTSMLNPKSYHDMIIDGNNLYHDEIILKKMMLDCGINTCWVKNDIDGYKVWKKCSFIIDKIQENSESKGALHTFNNRITAGGVRNGDVVVRKYLSNIGYDISIVIPIRNVSGFIDKFNILMNSISEQLFSRYEVILVNDNSDDNTRNILNSYSQDNCNIKVINNTSQTGIGNARNIGIEHSTGEFIWIIDGDDRLYDKFVLSRLYQIANLNQQVDIIELKSQTDSGKLFDRKYTRDIFEKELLFAQGEYLTWNLSRNPIIASWGRVYNRKFLMENKTIRFSNTKFCNDLYFRLQGDSLAKNVFISNGFTSYVYNMNTTTSISSITKKSKNFDEYWKIFNDINNVSYRNADIKISVMGDMYQRMCGVLSTINRCIGKDEYNRCLTIFSQILKKYELCEFVNVIEFNKTYPTIMKDLKIQLGGY